MLTKYVFRNSTKTATSRRIVIAANTIDMISDVFKPKSPIWDYS